jgi:NADH-quinone oxidoreductase subunit L
MTPFLILLTIGLPWLGALLVWLMGNQRPKAQDGLAVVFAVAAGLAALLLLPLAEETAVLHLSTNGILGEVTFVPDGLATLLAAIATVIGSLTVIFSAAYMKGQPQLGRYYVLVLLFIGAMAGLALTGSMLLLFVFWEITALCSYALIAFDNDNPAAVRGGIKALIITQFGGIGLLLLALTAYSYLGSYQIEQFLAQAGTLPTAVLATLAFGSLVAAAAKSAQLPFHTWLPDAMEAPTPVSALIHAATMVNAGVYLLARLYPAFAAVPGWRTAVILVGLFSVLLAGMMALTTFDLKRALAYSTISQLGYMIAAIGLGDIFASQFHLLSHALFKAMLFLTAGAIIHALGTRDMRQMGGLGQQMPLLRTIFLLGALALAGLPPLNGFWSKELILEAGLVSGHWWAYLGLLLGAGLTAVYTIRMTRLVFWGEPRQAHQDRPLPPAMTLPLILLATGTLGSWLLAGPLSQTLHGTLPFHQFHALTTWQMMDEVIVWETAVALTTVLLGGVVWWQRSRLQKWFGNLIWLQKTADRSFGFEAINHGLTVGAQRTAALLQKTQTGQLNWNVLGIIAGALLVLLILWGSI